MITTVRALLFDFDGLILDTETPELHVWSNIYAEYGVEYPLERGLQNVGRWGNSTFDPAGYLHESIHDSLDVKAIQARHRVESAALIGRQPVRDGVQDYLTEARRLGLHLAVASSSPRDWVESHLTRLGLQHRFDTIVTADDVAPGRTKPHPDIYLKVLEQLSVSATDAIAFEDSPPGLAAARASGIFTVAVPNPSTALLDLGGADLVISSLSALPLDQLLRRAGR